MWMNCNLTWDLAKKRRPQWFRMPEGFEPAPMGIVRDLMCNVSIFFLLDIICLCPIAFDDMCCWSTMSERNSHTEGIIFTWRIFNRCLLPGSPMWTVRSNLPGRNKARSKASFLFVAPITRICHTHKKHIRFQQSIKASCPQSQQPYWACI